MPIIDQHNRPINYLRLAVTDRCNLRCSYCMPEHGMKFLHKSALLSFEEMLRLCEIMAKMGVNKVRITGGEPFVRNNLMDFLWKLSDIEGITEIALTTNGVLTEQYLKDLKALGIKTVNLSLDTLDKKRFFDITKRDEYDKVMSTLYRMIEQDFEVKINAVVMEGQNTEDILSLTEFTKNNPVSVRFIEEMPFNGIGAHSAVLNWDYMKILEEIKSQYPTIQKVKDSAFSTSYNYQIPNHQGSIGIIAAYSRTFCGTCNRIRITAQGELKTCLYQHKGLSIRDLIRSGLSNEAIEAILYESIQKRPKDGYEAESLGPVISESMSAIGG
ncbi:MAG: GTP 3',8-cyclase MoaA [Bacteroidota bacterium]